MEKVLHKDHSKVSGMGRRKRKLYMMPQMSVERARAAQVSKNFDKALELWAMLKRTPSLAFQR